jgi:hypothetical protein
VIWIVSNVFASLLEVYTFLMINMQKVYVDQIEITLMLIVVMMGLFGSSASSALLACAFGEPAAAADVLGI